MGLADRLCCSNRRAQQPVPPSPEEGHSRAPGAPPLTPLTRSLYAFGETLRAVTQLVVNCVLNRLVLQQSLHDINRVINHPRKLNFDQDEDPDEGTLLRFCACCCALAFADILPSNRSDRNV